MKAMYPQPGNQNAHNKWGECLRYAIVYTDNNITEEHGAVIRHAGICMDFGRLSALPGLIRGRTPHARRTGNWRRIWRRI